MLFLILFISYLIGSIPFGFLFAAIFLGEEITPLKSGGAVFVMIGVALPHFLRSSKNTISFQKN